MGEYSASRPPALDEHFEGDLSPRWTRTCPGGGTLDLGNSALRLGFPSARAGVYTDAQIDDYDHLPPSRFPWRPPLRLEVRARASHRIAPTEATQTIQAATPPAPTDVFGAPGAPIIPAPYLLGTAGFGFWNYPFSLTGAALRLPEAVWFFAASPPSQMLLVPGSPGWGWKAQVVHTQRWGALAATIPAAASVLWARGSGQQQPAARWVQRLSGASEAVLTTDLREWHTYTLEWRRDEARFVVDGVTVLVVPDPPPGPLGFVAWIDNQYALATPRGTLRFGTLASGPQWLDLDLLRMTPLT